MKDKAANHPADSDALHAAGRDLRERAPYPMVRETSWYAQAQMNPQVSAAAVAGGLALIYGWLKLRAALHDRRIRRETIRSLAEED